MIDSSVPTLKLGFRKKFSLNPDFAPLCPLVYKAQNTVLRIAF